LPSAGGSIVLIGVSLKACTLLVAVAVITFEFISIHAILCIRVVIFSLSEFKEVCVVLPQELEELRVGLLQALQVTLVTVCEKNDSSSVQLNHLQ
jgi:hypothetical protein